MAEQGWQKDPLLLKAHSVKLVLLAIIPQLMLVHAPPVALASLPLPITPGAVLVLQVHTLLMAIASAVPMERSAAVELLNVLLVNVVLKPMRLTMHAQHVPLVSSLMEREYVATAQPVHFHKLRLANVNHVERVIKPIPLPIHVVLVLLAHFPLREFVKIVHLVRTRASERRCVKLVVVGCK